MPDSLNILTPTPDERRRLHAGERVEVDGGRVEPQPPAHLPDVWQRDDIEEGVWLFQWHVGDRYGVTDSTPGIRCPYAVGDRVRIGEEWWSDRRDDGVMMYADTPEWGLYRVEPDKPVRSSYMGGEPVAPDDSRANLEASPYWSKQPAATLPAWAVRTFARVVAVDARCVDGAWRWFVQLERRDA